MHKTQMKSIQTYDIKKKNDGEQPFEIDRHRKEDNTEVILQKHDGLCQW